MKNSIPVEQETGGMLGGEYYTNHGLLTFSLKGPQVSGTYLDEGRSIEGEFEGTELKGSWKQQDRSGSIILSFAPDFSTFKARYNHMETPDKWDTNWYGRLKPRIQICGYQTPWGLLVCHFEGSQVSGTYPWMNGKILGELNGLLFKGLWLQCDTGVGLLNLTFADDFGSFKGVYNDFNHHPDTWYEWNGTLRQ